MNNSAASRLLLGLAVGMAFAAPNLRRAYAQPAAETAAPDMAELGRHRAALVAQCPASPTLDPAQADALPINVVRWGTEGPRIVIIHGGVQGRLGGGPDTFLKQQAWASEGFQVELVQRPGFGQSPTRGVDDMDREAVWIAGMLGDGANLIGHSWGGADALLAAARRPGRGPLARPRRAGFDGHCRGRSHVARQPRRARRRDDALPHHDVRPNAG